MLLYRYTRFFAAQLTRDERIVRFHTWMLHCGVDLEAQGLSISVCEGEKGLGVVTTKAIEAGQRVLTVPRKAMMTGDDVAKSPLGPIIESMPMLQQMPMFSMALYLIGQVHAANTAGGGSVGAAASAAQAAELQSATPAAAGEPFPCSRVLQSSGSAVTMQLRGGARPVAADVTQLKAGSKWRPYLAMLPRTLTCVLYWSVADLQALVGARSSGALLAFSALRFVRSAVKHYTVLHSALITGLPSAQKQASAAGLTAASFTWSSYRWALSVVMSRQNMVPSALDEGRNTLAFVPGWDLLNHEDTAAGKITTSYAGGSGSKRRAVIQSGSLLLEAVRAFRAGEEVTMFYGRRPNRELMQFSGFSLDCSKWDAPLIELPAPGATDPLAKVRRLILGNLGLKVSPAVAAVGADTGAIVMPLVDVPPPPHSHSHGDSCGSGCGHSHAAAEDSDPPAPTISTCVWSYARVMVCDKAQLGELLALGRGLTEVPPLGSCLSTGGPQAEAEAAVLLHGHVQKWLEEHPTGSPDGDDGCEVGSHINVFLQSQRTAVQAVLSALSS